ncbi:MAG: hypothetical protein A3G01_03465 [Candidatus Kerfeldbacteria bacterium RIFCSPLOWO2_12_FULL_43_9]|nr:MAG: hypothetical protein A3G01_03465 [Candidatus Kerfeldbacteria bacterium RIFCSPLOWO2_12_FULL_43_9]
MSILMGLSPNTLSYAIRKTKEAEDSRFRSTNIAQCAEKGESSVSLVVYVTQKIVFGDRPFMITLKFTAHKDQKML